MNDENASRAIAGWSRDQDLVGLVKGQFSLIDLLRAVLERTGPADLTVSTWTAAKKEIDDAAALLADERIRSIRWLVDFSFPRRQPAYCQQLRDRFGDDVIRVTKNHAKFVLVRNDEWSAVVRTSMNLNRNARLEYFEISDDVELADFYERVVAEVFGIQASGEGFSNRPYDNVQQFEEVGRAAAAAEASRWGADPDESADRWGRDLEDPLAPGISVLGGGGG